MNEEAKLKHSKRIQQKKNYVEKQVRIAKTKNIVLHGCKPLANIIVKSNLLMVNTAIDTMCTVGSPEAKTSDQANIRAIGTFYRLFPRIRPHLNTFISLFYSS